MTRRGRWQVYRSRALVAAWLVLLIALMPMTAKAADLPPIPNDPAIAPPPIPVMPAAGPLAPTVPTPGACGPWLLTGTYGDRWSTTMTWWEYTCTSQIGPCVYACNADGHEGDFQRWIDHFVFDGAGAVFYGESYAYQQYWGDSIGAHRCSLWWDQPSSQWYVLDDPCTDYVGPNQDPLASFTSVCASLVCTFDASPSWDDGAIVGYAWDFGDGATAAGMTTAHAYPGDGIYPVMLTVTDDRGARATSTTQVSVAYVNHPPVAEFTMACTGLACTFDARGSSDPDGAITGFRWDFGDGQSGSGSAASHAYVQARAWTVTLRVDDDAGATTSTSRSVTPIVLDAHGYKVRGTRTVDLSWTGATGVGFQVSRGGIQIASVSRTTYTDTLGGRGSGTFEYVVCQNGASVCSRPVSVTF